MYLFQEICVYSLSPHLITIQHVTHVAAFHLHSHLLHLSRIFRKHVCKQPVYTVCEREDRAIVGSGLGQSFSSCVLDSVWITTDGLTVTHWQLNVAPWPLAKQPHIHTLWWKSLSIVVIIINNLRGENWHKQLKPFMHIAVYCYSGDELTNLVAEY